MKFKLIICFILGIIISFSSLSFINLNNIILKAEEINLSKEETLPDAYSLRDDYIIFAQNQDSHGYCWNFASTMAASTTIMKATGEYYDFSELWTGVSFYNCANSYKKMGAGGSLSYQYDAMKKSGLMLESDLPYQYANIVSNENVVDYYNFFEKYSNDDLASTLVYDNTLSFKQENIDDIKKHLYHHGSLYLAFSFRTGFMEDGNAYYLDPNQKNTNSSHAVSLIGWDDNYQKEFYLDGSTTPTVFKGAWMILNSYTEKSGIDGISYIFYDDQNISSIMGYRYETDTNKDLYFYDKIESGYSYPNHLKGKYYTDYQKEENTTKQKNIFYDDVKLEYSYISSPNTSIKQIDIYLDNQNVTNQFNIKIDDKTKKFSIYKQSANYGQYKVIITYGNNELTDTYLNNFYVTYGLIGEEIEYDYDQNNFTFNPGRDLEHYSFISPNKNYVIYTNSLSGKIEFIQTKQSVYSEQNMSIPTISYEITNGKNVTSTYKISNRGYDLNYNFTFEYYEDISLQPVNIYYDLGGGVNHKQNYHQELANETTDLVLYEPTRVGYTFKGWYLDYGNGSKQIEEVDGKYYLKWDDIHHLGKSPTLNASSNYTKYYNNANTVFVYARWEELDYYNIDITTVGEGTSQINETISISNEDSVRYILKANSNNTLADLKINNVSVSSDELINISKYGLVLDNINQDISIIVTFKDGLYLSLKSGENIKSAYLLGTLNNLDVKFYHGDLIPSEFFKKNSQIITPIKPLDTTLKKESSIKNIINTDSKIIFIPFGSAQFTLVVEVFDDEEGYTYVLDNVSSYEISDNRTFSKTLVISGRDKFYEINVGNASKQPIKEVELTYEVNENVADHYISNDPNSLTGNQGKAKYNAGDIVYLFIKKLDDNIQYKYLDLDDFEKLKNGWFRKKIYVNPLEPNIGKINVEAELQKYTVTWKNYDGSIIYTENYQYGKLPVFYNKNSEIKDYPTKPDDDYSYVFIGWDKEITEVTKNITYTAKYEKILRRYIVTVEDSINGTIYPNGKNYISQIDKHTYLFIPSPGYQVKDVKINGSSIGNVTSYTFSNVTSDQKISVEFEKTKYEVKIFCDENGYTNQEKNVLVEYEESLIINITPKELFDIGYIKINGEQVTITNPLIIDNVSSDLIVEITFKQIIFNISTTSSKHGSITKSNQVALGESVKLEFKADIFYKVKDVIIDGKSVGNIKHYTFVDVNSNHLVTVTYGLNIVMIIIILVMALITSGIVILIVSKKHNKTPKVINNQETE